MFLTHYWWYRLDILIFLRLQEDSMLTEFLQKTDQQKLKLFNSAICHRHLYHHTLAAQYDYRLIKQLNENLRHLDIPLRIKRISLLQH